MKDRPKTRWQGMRRNVRNRLVSGMLALVPVGITLLVMRWVLQWMAGFFQPLVEHLVLRLTTALDLGEIPPQAMEIPLMIVSVLGFLAAVYLTGALAQAMIGRRLIHAGETVLMRVPLASTIYSSAKQVMEAIAAPTRSALRTVVLVEFPRRGTWSVGFMTGRLLETQGRGMLKVFVPTTPNPTTGFFVIVPQEDVIMTEMTVEEAFKMIISGGIVSPESLGEKMAVGSRFHTDPAATREDGPRDTQGPMR
jgi:uncharacterized membrane protein